MSFHRENVTWQSNDGTWSIGFWSFTEQESSWEDDYDNEWDVEYMYDSFWFVSTGHVNTESAWNDYTRYHSNPGSTTIMPYKGNSAECKRLDRLAFRFKNPELAKKEDQAEARKKNREHQKKVAVEFAEKIEGNKLFALLTVSVVFADPATVHTNLGLTTDVLGKLTEEGDWITVGGRKVFNMKTKKVANNVHRIRFAHPSYYSTPRWR